MVKIAIFDSGFGSLSIIKPIQKRTKSEIIYFADQKNFPYGKKSKKQLDKIIQNTIKMLKHKFNPELIVVASNTPSLLLKIKNNSKVIGVLPPLKQAIKKTKTNNIGILSTQSVVKSKELSNFIKKNKIPKKVNAYKINASPLVSLVENGKFITNKKETKKIIQKTLKNQFTKNNIDTATLSSTHLPFLIPFLKKEFPDIIFLNPADSVANEISSKYKASKRNSMKIFTSSDPKKFQKLLEKIKIKNKVIFLS